MADSTPRVETVKSSEFSSNAAAHPASSSAFIQRTEGQFAAFNRRLDKELLNHRVITHPPYTPWFADGQVNHEQLQAFVVEFSVFSNQFLVAQMLKMLAANSLEEMRASKEILANEMGVAFHATSQGFSSAGLSESEAKNFGDITGSVEGGRFHFRAAHFELLLHCAEFIGLDFNQLGKRCFGSEKTLFFCDELQRLYGSENYQVSAAASFAVENWAAAGFWQQLVDGLRLMKKRPEYLELPITFFSWHNKLEANHAHHTRQELREYYFSHSVDEDAFIKTGNCMLDGVQAFWEGLDQQRLRLVH